MTPKQLRDAVHYLVTEAWMRCAAAWVGRRNRTSTDAVTGDGGVDVTLTTYGHRVETVHVTIESIARGTVKPERLILWLDEAVDVPDSLRRLVARGLEIRRTPDYGPHSKYFTYTQTCYGSPMVLADDDIIYPRTWLAGLVEAHEHQPNVVNCYRAHRVTRRGDGFAPYMSWERCVGTTPSTDHFATGVSGVIYGPEMVTVIRDAGDAFRTVAPRADDVWLYFLMTSAGFAVRQIGTEPRAFAWLPGTRSEGLAMENNLAGGNDEQIASVAMYFGAA